MHVHFKDRIVLVTGATRGIGKQIADDLGELGAELILTGTNKEEITRLQKAGQDKEPSHHWYAVDFTKSESIKSFLQEIETFDKIDICINNAGINKINPVDLILEEDWDNIMRVNLDAPFLITRAVSKIMKKHNYGRIVNIGSVFGVVSKEERAAYSVSKYGIRGLTIASALDLAAYNILVNTVSPGFVSTDLTKKVLGPEGMKEMASKVPLARLAVPEDISKVVLFMVSDLNTYITGQNIIVDGGFVNV